MIVLTSIFQNAYIIYSTTIYYYYYLILNVFEPTSFTYKDQ